MIKPCGYYVLIKPDAVETAVNGIIVSTPSEEKKESRAQVIGTILSLGPTAFEDYGGQDVWACSGDRVVYSKYGGKFIKDPANGEEFVLVNDNDIVAILTEEKEDE